LAINDSQPNGRSKRPKGPLHRERRISQQEIDTILVVLNYDERLSREAIRLLKRIDPWCDDGTVFGMAYSKLSTLYKRAVDRTDVKDLTFHDTRHEAITRLADKLDVLGLARMVGHRYIKQLMTYYNKSASELAEMLD
jgi:integrase